MPEPVTSERSAPVSLQFEAPFPSLVDGMDEEELAITVGLGLVAREAAAVEYVLHGIYVHLKGITKAYSKLAVAPGGTLVTQCQGALKTTDDSALADSDRASLDTDLDLADKAFQVRNRFLHGYWQFDDVSQSWWTLKGAHDGPIPEARRTNSGDVWDLVGRFRQLHERLTLWDIAHFKELAEAEDGTTGWASVKHI